MAYLAGSGGSGGERESRLVVERARANKDQVCDASEEERKRERENGKPFAFAYTCKWSMIYSVRQLGLGSQTRFSPSQVCHHSLCDRPTGAGMPVAAAAAAAVGSGGGGAGQSLMKL